MRVIYSLKCKKIKLPKYIWFIILRKAGLQFHFSIEVVSIQDVPEILMGAGIAGNYNLFKMFFDKWGKDRGYWYEIFRCACRGGNRNIMDLCYYQDVDEGLIGAFIGGHYLLAEYFIKKGANMDEDFGEICLYADLKHIEVAFAHIDDDETIGRAIVCICETIRLDVLEFLLDKGRLIDTNGDHIISIVDTNNTIVADYLIEIDEELLEDIMSYAIESDNMFMIEYCIKKGFKNFNTALEWADSNSDLINFFKKKKEGL
jgi:hypothetical protein